MARALTEGGIHLLPTGVLAVCRADLDPFSLYSYHLYRRDNWPPIRLPDFMIDRRTGAILARDGRTIGSLADLRDTGVTLTTDEPWPQLCSST